MDTQEAYRILGVSFGATKKEIDNAYFRNIKNLSSKDYEDEPEYAAQRLSLVQEARERITVSGYQGERHGGGNEEYEEYDNRRGISMQRQERSGDSKSLQGCASPQYAVSQTDVAEANMSNASVLRTPPMPSNYAKLAMLRPPTYIKPVSTIANYTLPMTATASIALKPSVMGAKLPISGLGFGLGLQMSPSVGFADMSVGAVSVTDLEPKKHIEDCELGDETNADSGIARKTAADRMRSIEQASDRRISDKKLRTARGAVPQQEGKRAGVRSNNGACYGSDKALGGCTLQQNRAGQNGMGIKHLSQYDKDVIEKRASSQKSEFVKNVVSIFSGRADLNGKTVKKIAAYDKAKTLGIIGGFIIFILPIALGLLGGIGSLLGGTDVHEGGRGYEYEEAVFYEDEVDEFVNALDEDQMQTFNTVMAFLKEAEEDLYEKLDDTQADAYYDMFDGEYKDNGEAEKKLIELCNAMGIASVDEFVYIFTLGQSKYMDYTFEERLSMFAEVLHCPSLFEAGGCINRYRDTPILNISDYIDFLTDTAVKKRVKCDIP